MNHIHILISSYYFFGHLCFSLIVFVSVVVVVVVVLVVDFSGPS